MKYPMLYNCPLVRHLVASIGSLIRYLALERLQTATGFRVALTRPETSLARPGHCSAVHSYHLHLVFYPGNRRAYSNEDRVFCYDVVVKYNRQRAALFVRS